MDKQELMIRLEEAEALTADGFDNALIGIADGVAVYDLHKCRGELMLRDGMTDEEAQEYLDYNVVGSYVGPKTPIFVELVN